MREIGRETKIIIAEGHTDWLRGKGFTNVSELAWHASAEISPVHPGDGDSGPAFHRENLARPKPRPLVRLAGRGGGGKLWHAGDSGYCPAFSEIGGRYGPIDFGMIPIGAYLPRRIMRAMHMNPEEAVRAFLESRCRRAVAMHWGTFQLTDEPLGEPPILLEKGAAGGVPGRGGV